MVGGWGEGREGAISREGGERGGNNIRYYSLLIDENVYFKFSQEIVTTV